MNDWKPIWREKFPGWNIDDVLWVGPPWLTPPTGLIPIVIDPSGSQGTGAHPTTRICLSLLARLRAESFQSVLDVGCGSGVLGIAAAKLGFTNITCLDIDESCLAETRRNAEANGVTVTTVCHNLLVSPLPEAELVMANFGSPKSFPFPLARVRAAITSGYDVTVSVPRVGSLRRIEAAEGGYKGHLHK